MSLISRLEDSIRGLLRGAIAPGEVDVISDDELAVLESRLVDLFMEYAAEHYKLVTKDDDR